MSALELIFPLDVTADSIWVEPLIIPLGNCDEPLIIPLGNCDEPLITPAGRTVVVSMEITQYPS